MNSPWNLLKSHDAEVFDLIEKEFGRQQDGIELIASENIASPQVISCMGNILNNKYAEGRPGKRYYGGCEHVDVLENLAIDRVCKIFGANFANVQPHSGAQANAAVMLALLKPGDHILGMDLSHGGHLSHGSKVNLSGQYYQSHFYGLDQETELLDMDSVRRIALDLKPKLIIAGASSYPRAIDFKAFREIADEVGAFLLVDMAHIAGLVASQQHQNPVPHAHVVTSTTHKTLRGPRGGVILWNDEKLSTSINKGVFPGTQGGPLEHIIAAKAVCFKEAMGDDFKQYQQQVLLNSKALCAEFGKRKLRMVSGGSDNHLILLDLSNSEVSGKALEEALEKVAITLNKNTVPNEKRSPFVTSGIRVGTPAVTSRGMKESEMSQIASFICDVFENISDDKRLMEIQKEVLKLTKKFPIYPDWTNS